MAVAGDVAAHGGGSGLVCASGDGTEPVLYRDAIALSFHLIPADSGKVRRLTEAGCAALHGSTGAG
jgi:hypothetical protein